jgi:hypothetical protein
MSKHSRRSVTKGPVGNKKRPKDISQEPEFQELKAVFEDMTDVEKGRTIDYLTESDEEGDRNGEK